MFLLNHQLKELILGLKNKIMVKKAITFLLISILFVNCKKDKTIVLSSSNYGDIINQEFTGDLAFNTTSFVEKYWRIVGNTELKSAHSKNQLGNRSTQV